MCIIRDPKMNDKEKLYGIVYIPTLRGCFKYRKKRNDASRFVVAGSIVDVDLKNVNFYQDPLIIDGMIVLGTIENPKIVDQTATKGGPVTKWHKENGSDTLDETQMDILIGDNTEL